MKPRISLPPALEGIPFTNAEAREHGVGRGRLTASDLESPFRGVHMAAGRSTSIDALCAGLAKRVPKEAFFVGLTAARLWGAPLPRWAESQPLHVAVSSGTAPTGRGVRGSVRRTVPELVTTLRGHRLSRASTTWVDLASELPLRDLVAVGDYLVHRRCPLTTRSAIAEEIESSAGRRGMKLARAAWDLLDEGAESRKESHLRVLLVTGGIGQFQANAWIVTADGYRYRGDLVDPVRRIVIEYQSAFHHDSERQEADMIRRSRLQADGWIVIEVSRLDLRHASDLLARIRRTLALR